MMLDRLVCGCATMEPIRLNTILALADEIEWLMCNDRATSRSVPSSL